VALTEIWPLIRAIQPSPVNSATRSSSPLGLPGSTPPASSSTSTVAATNDTVVIAATVHAHRRGPIPATAPIPATPSVTEIS
jgi:hypothetical protein